MWPWRSVPFLLFLHSIHGSWGEEKKKNNGDGAGVHISVRNGCPAQGDGRCHAGTGGCPATEVDGPWERNAELSDEPASSDAWTDQQRKPPETPRTGGQDTLEGSFRSLNGCLRILGNTWFPAQLTRAYTNNFIFHSFSQQCCSFHISEFLNSSHYTAPHYNCFFIHIFIWNCSAGEMYWWWQCEHEPLTNKTDLLQLSVGNWSLCVSESEIAV